MTINKIAFALFFFLCSFRLLAQNSLPATISSGSSGFAGQNVNFAYTIGSVFVGQTTNNESLTPIFVQPEFISTKQAAKTNELKIQVYPNPVINSLSIRFFSEKETEIKVEINDLTGKRIHTQAFSFHESEHNKLIKLNLEDLTAAYYIVSLKDKHQKVLSSFKIIKK